MKKTVYTKYSTERGNQFKIVTSIQKDDEGNRWVEKRAAHRLAQPHIESLPQKYEDLKEYYKETAIEPVHCELVGSKAIFSYIDGESLESRLSRCIKEDDLKGLLHEIENYRNMITSNVELVPFHISESFVEVFGSNYPEEGIDAFPVSDIDLIFSNIIISDDKWYVIDYEWTYHFPVPVNYIVFRAVKFYVEWFYGRSIADSNIYGYLGISERERKTYESMELFFQNHVQEGATLSGRLYDSLCGKNIYLQDIINKNIDSADFFEVQVFYDKGSGFSEEDSYKLYKPLNEMVDLEIAGTHDLRSIRIDPCADYCIVRILDTAGVSDQYYHPEISTNGVDLGGNCYLFSMDDPQIYLRALKEHTGKVFIRFEVQILQALYVYHLCKLISNFEETAEAARLEKDSLLHSIYDLQQNLGALGQENENQKLLLQELNDKLLAAEERLREAAMAAENAEFRYQSIVCSRFWRFTKPMRSVISKLKKIRILRLTGKTMISIKRYGIRETFRKIARRVSHKKAEINGSLTTSTEYLIEYVEEDILFSIIVPLYNTDLLCLKELLDSITQQKYSNWELILGDASDHDHDEVRKCCEEYIKQDGRIKYYAIENRGISENSDYCIQKANGDYIVLCDHDDVMDKQALIINASVIHDTLADVLYSDEDHIDKEGNHVLPLYKPDWSPDLLRSQMYTCHLFVFKKTLYHEVGGFRKEYDGSQDYDLMLRFSETTKRIVHIPVILYSWREIETSTSVNADAKPYASRAGLKALSSHLQRQFGDSARAFETEYPFVYEVSYGLMDRYKPFISIIIPMKDQYKLTDQCIKSIIELSSYSKYEILILNNRSEEEETYLWFEEIVKYDARIHVMEADFEFNWSKLNNFGMEYASGDVFIFLNNDTLIISKDWMERLCDYTLREEVGVVGPTLLYEDNTIQHAGIIVGMGGWADHVFKGMEMVHFGSPFISPMVTRNVMAVTGACMAVARKTVDRIGGFDEEFIICGSDVEFCIRAFKHGLENIFLAGVQLYHLESKSRDSYIPEIDFQKSYECYSECREFGDPYYNINLDGNSPQPRQEVEMDWLKVKEHIKNNRLTAGAYQKVKEKIVGEPEINAVRIPEIQEICARKAELPKGKIRINILLPSIDVKHVFGGISTALDFYKNLSGNNGYLRRIIVTDAIVEKQSMIDLPDYEVVDAQSDSVSDNQIIPFANRAAKTIPVAENDIFIATGWWTAYTIAEVIHWQTKEYAGIKNPLLYMVQDYEPGFYPWSSRYLMADSTYQLDIKTIAIINSSELFDFMEENGYHFYKTLLFEPRLNIELKRILEKSYHVKSNRKKQILIYGRPSVERNAFALIVGALKKWVLMQKDIEEWSIISAGENFGDIDLGNGKIVHSIGKVSLEEYAQIMLETKIGLSFMVSPHPSYPPLEMSTFGMRVITNHYGNKDLSNFNSNITSLTNCSAGNIAKVLCNLCDGEEGQIQKESNYVKSAGIGQWDEIVSEIVSELDKDKSI